MLALNWPDLDLTATALGSAQPPLKSTHVLAAVLTWPLGDDVSDAALEALLYREPGDKTGHRRCAEPDWPQLHREMQRKHVTLQIVWDEYIAAHPGGYRYSRFCDLYLGWALKLPVTMRQNHAPGDSLFVDYAGDTIPVVVDRLTGEVRDAHIFVGVLAPPACPTRRRPGPRRCPTGSAPTCARWRPSAARRRCSCQTMPSTTLAG